MHGKPKGGRGGPVVVHKSRETPWTSSPVHTVILVFRDAPSLVRLVRSHGGRQGREDTILHT